MKSSSATWALLVGLLVSLASPLAADEPLHYEPVVVQVSGVVVVEVHYGPPNYGENPESDETERALILLLDMPATVLGDPNSDMNRETMIDVARLHLVASPEFGLSKLVWRHVTVEGTLFRSFTAHHRTDVLIDVDRIIESGPIR